MKPSMELSLVAFTVLSQFAIGIALLYALRGAVAGRAPEAGAQRQWIVATALLAAGVLLSLLHLGHPLKAPLALSNLGTSWLSREVLLASLLVALMAATAWRVWQWPLVIATAVVGLATLFVQGMVYSPPGLPALHNAFPFAFFLLTAVILGAGASAWFAPADRQPLVRGVLIAALCAALLIYFVAPIAWLTSGSVEQSTGRAWFASPFYWVNIVVGLALPLALVLRMRRIPGWLPLLLLVGAVAGRIGFYFNSVHAAAHMGGLY